MKRLIALTLITILIGVLTMSCSKETIKEITGPTEYDSTIVEVPVYTPTKVHAYSISQVFLDPEILTYIESVYSVTITGWTGHYSCLWNAMQITQSGNTFNLAGSVTPLFTITGDPYNLYYDVVEYADLALVYISGDPSDPDNWTANWTASTTTFKAQGMFKQ